MELSAKKDSNTLTVAVSGRIDSSTVKELEAAIKENLPGTEELVYDFAQLEYISSAGLRVLLASHKLISGKMKIVNANETVRDVFKITGMEMIFNIE